ncbi:hypothetical protein [Falsiroseomonas sp. HW251]|uniref:hypothetical protein n=1 Tax=Falsiroseomonas sp. HW251 TaxID=3390998 RepID=UPI003D31753F
MQTQSNRPTLESVHNLPVGDVIALPADQLALLQSDAREAVDSAKRMQDWIEAAVALRYEQRAIGARAEARKDTGTVRFQDGTVEIAVELPKRVEWDQRRLATLADQIRTGGEDPSEYLEVSFKVSERAYTAWPERIRRAFEPARTVRTGRPVYRLTIMSETERRDSPHASTPFLFGEIG